MNRKLAVVGLGYVGLPVAISFGNYFNVLGFDINSDRISELKRFYDRTGELTEDELKVAKVQFTNDPLLLRNCDFIIVAVPTPINNVNQPDLSPLIRASEIVGENLSSGTIVVFESTVFPGATEDICKPILENKSGLKCGTDFYLGYSPERINPGDKERTFTKITKVVSASDNDTLSVVADVYGTVIEKGIFRASSIKVAEAAKVIENTQRDLNIALMNELSLIFDKMGIDTLEVIEAASTKWNFIPFRPGLVGGHCIGVDPYYLTYKAESLGYHPQVILAGRRINDSMANFVVTSIIKKMILKGMNLRESVIHILGLTFKENVPDIRNSKVFDIVSELEEYGVCVRVSDCYADSKEVMRKSHLSLIDINNIEKPSDVLILSVPHREYVDLGWTGLKQLVKQDGVVVDLKGALDKQLCPSNISYWRL